VIHNNHNPTELGHHEQRSNVQCFKGRQQYTKVILKYYQTRFCTSVYDLGGAAQPMAGRGEGGLSPAKSYAYWTVHHLDI